MPNSPKYPSRPAAEVDPTGEFERAFAENAGTISERLKRQCNCNIDSTPCSAEEECREILEAARIIERLRKLLEPFAREADDWPTGDDDERLYFSIESSDGYERREMAYFRLGDLKAARAALGEKP